MDETLPHPNGDRSSSRYGRVEKVSVSKVVKGKGGLSSVDQFLHESEAEAEADNGYIDYNTIVWGPLNLESGGTFKGRIRNVRITEITGVYNWLASLSFDPVDLTTVDK